MRRWSTILTSLALAATLGSAACSPSDEADCSEPIFLTQNGNGEVLLDGEPMPRDKVVPTMSARYADRKACRIMIKAERTITYSDAMLLIDELRAAGFSRFAVVTVEDVQ